MAPPPATTVPPLVFLFLRVLTFASLLISLILLITTSDSLTISDYGDEVKLKFTSFYAYKYLCAATVIGLAYALLQTVFNVCLVATRNRFGGDGLVYFDFYADKIVSYVLATGAAASFGLTQEIDRTGGIDKFVSKTNAAASLCLVGCLFTASASVFSAFALPKRVA